MKGPLAFSLVARQLLSSHANMAEIRLSAVRHLGPESEFGDPVIQVLSVSDAAGRCEQW